MPAYEKNPALPGDIYYAARRCSGSSIGAKMPRLCYPDIPSLFPLSFPNLFFVFWPQQCSLPGWQFAFSLSLIEGAYHNARLFLCRFASSPSADRLADRLHEFRLLTCKCPHNGLGSLPVSSIRHPRSGQGDNMPGRRNVPSFRLFGSMIE